jgi:hypothetical protein
MTSDQLALDREQMRVRALGPTRFLPIPGAAVRELMFESTAVDRAVRERAFRRLHRAPV